MTRHSWCFPEFFNPKRTSCGQTSHSRGIIHGQLRTPQLLPHFANRLQALLSPDSSSTSPQNVCDHWDTPCVWPCPHLRLFLRNQECQWRNSFHHAGIWCWQPLQELLLLQDLPLQCNTNQLKRSQTGQENQQPKTRTNSRADRGQGSCRGPEQQPLSSRASSQNHCKQLKGKLEQGWDSSRAQAQSWLRQSGCLRQLAPCSGE